MGRPLYYNIPPDALRDVRAELALFPHDFLRYVLCFSFTVNPIFFLGKYMAAPQLEVTICDLKTSNSFLVISNMKSFSCRDNFLRDHCNIKPYLCAPVSDSH